MKDYVLFSQFQFEADIELQGLLGSYRVSFISSVNFYVSS